MARPKPDTDKVKAALLHAAERQLADSDGRRLVLSDLAKQLGMSQSYVHRFFPTKSDLIRTLAENWFHEVEHASEQAAKASAPAAVRLEDWLLAVLRIKRARFDENPTLFLAYLELAKDHQDIVRAHVAALSAHMQAILRDLVAPQQLPEATVLVETATLLFRTPQNIAQYRDGATDDTARRVVRMLIDEVSRWERV